MSHNDFQPPEPDESPPDEPMENHIVCAALRHEDGRIVCGVRHFDARMIEVLKQLPGWETRDWSGAEQGFVDRNGNFLTREAAWPIADAAQQIIRDPDWMIGTLFSEHLY